MIQAYQKRCPFVIDYLIDLATRSRRRLMIRLVKGAYWDSEIKRAQMEGLEGYPVYTRKVYTDVSYLASARKLLAVPNLIYPQFATHNAHTLAAIYQLAGQNYYRASMSSSACTAWANRFTSRWWAGRRRQTESAVPDLRPVGTHETLLAYLVRRLLENGANTSFVNRIADNTLPLDELVADPVSAVENWRSRKARPACRIRNPAAARSLRQRPEQLRRSRSGERAPSGLLSSSCSTARCINGRHCRCWSSRWPKARCSRWLTRQSRRYRRLRPRSQRR